MYYRVYGLNKDGEYVPLKKLLNKIDVIEYILELDPSSFINVLVIVHDYQYNMDYCELLLNLNKKEELDDLKEKYLNYKYINIKNETFTKYDFAKLFIAMIYLRGGGVEYFNFYTLGYQLYNYFLLDNYVKLLSDFEVWCDNEAFYLDINSCIKKLNDEYIVNTKYNCDSEILLDECECGEIINSYDNEIVGLMYDFVNDYLEDYPNEIYLKIEKKNVS